MSPSNKLSILCVDDEPRILEGLKLHLARRYQVRTALSGKEGLEILKEHPETVAILSDMRMPEMDGATFLAQAKEMAPLTVRMLLTGETQISRAVSAVNEGELFRFLTKPCDPKVLLSVFDKAVEQHRLLTAEKEILQKTLIGSIRALVDILALTNPAAFGRATRIQKDVKAVANAMRIDNIWQIEAAAMLSQLGWITLSTATMQKMQNGDSLSDDERKQVARMPQVVCQLLAHIPRLEPVLEIIKEVGEEKRKSPSKASQALKVVLDFDQLESQCGESQLAMDTLRSRGDYDGEALTALGDLKGTKGRVRRVAEIPISKLKIGMVLAEEIIARNGLLLVGKGLEVSPSFLARINNFDKHLSAMTVKVIIETDEDSAQDRVA